MKSRPPAAASVPAAGRDALPARRRLGDVLIESRLLTPDQLEDALARQLEVVAAGRRVRLGRLLIEEGILNERDVAHAMADMLGLEMVDLGQEHIDPQIVHLLPRSVAERADVLILARTATGLRIAAGDPLNVIALDDVRAYTGAQELDVVVATESQISDHLARAWSLAETPSDMSMFEGSEVVEEEEPVDSAARAAENAPTVKLVNNLLADAVRLRASDVHIEPQQHNIRLRYRIDGLLRDVMTLPRTAGASLVSRVKIISGLDIAERRVPQDGRARLNVGTYAVDVRVSTLPSVHGEKVVVRLLSAAESISALAKIGLEPRQLDDLLAALLAPQGLILITGPTGSGKTNTLYSAINQIRTPDRNIVTLEDPVEMQVQGLTQVHVNERTGLTFARGLRAILRQDPDVVLVGEVRDTETAELAMQASMTGHLVLTTLHTNDAVSSLTRLVDMGIEPYLVASSLNLVVAQRLVRLPCPSCAAAYEPDPRVLTKLGLTAEDLAEATPLRGRGCGDCGETGYRGRTGVFEVLPVTPAMRSSLTGPGPEAALAAAARAAGVMTLRGAALRKAMNGETTFEEVLRVTHNEKLGGQACPSCARRLADDMVVCPWCNVSVSRGHCTGCSRPLDPDWKVCPWCRTHAQVIPQQPAPAASSVGRPRVLVVDDDPHVCEYVTAVLMETADVDAVTTASAALHRVSEKDYDVAVIDQGLPDLSGIELIRLLRSEVGTALLPLLLFTGQDGDDLEDTARNAGADDFVIKPADPELLEGRVLTLAKRSPRLTMSTQHLSS
ncbi:MAG: ATPase, T2SS/T4P/T4SS family [Actinomycetes bacterium]